MILANFNRTFSSPLLFLIFLISTGCSQQSPSSLTTNLTVEETLLQISKPIPITSTIVNGKVISKAITGEFVAPRKSHVFTSKPNFKAGFIRSDPVKFKKTDISVFEITAEFKLAEAHAKAQIAALAAKKLLEIEIALKEKLSKEKLSKEKLSKASFANLTTESVFKYKANPKNKGLIWDRMISLYALPKISNNRVKAEIKKFLKSPKYLATVQRRAAPYLHLILNEIEAKKLPGELALLPIVESAFKTNAVSHRSATGLWQFMPATGKEMGLKQNWWYDGRRDIYASTRAAITYLSQLSRSFNNDWLLALASYNVGIGNVNKAIRRNGNSKNYWTLKLPKETKQYVPKILALAEIFANAEKYNIKLTKIVDRPVVAIVKINKQLDLTKVAQMAGIPLKEFFVLNPAFNRVVTAPKSKHSILVKSKYAKIFKAKLAQLSINERVDWVEYTTKQGDNLKTVAKLYNTSVKDLLNVNKLRNKKLITGTVLRIPPKSIKELKKKLS